jgi:hypothetical protein
MRVSRFGIAVAVAAVVSFVGVACGEQLDMPQVSADAKWVAHIDVDALMASSIVKKAWDTALETNQDAAKRLEQVREMVGMDLKKDLHGITIYGTQIGKPSGVVIVNAKVDQKVLLAQAEKAPGYKVTQSGAYSVHTWNMPGRGGQQPRTVAGVFYKPDVMVLATSEDDLKAALDVLSGKTPGLRLKSPLAGKVPAGTAILLRAAGVNEAELPAQAGVIKQIESLQLSIGENKSELFIRADAVMTTTDAVAQVKTIIEGGQTLASMQIRDNEQLKKLLNALKVTSEDKTLSLAWSVASDEVWETAQKQVKAMAERRARRGGAGQPDPQPEKKSDGANK